MRTIERNYVKHPHTARFLMAFHTGTQGLPAEAEALKLEAAQDDDLLDLVPDGPVDLRSEGQRKLMDDLIGQLADLDPEAARRARTFQDGITERGTWTPGREGNASEWISRMIGKVRELKATAAPKVAQPVEVADGRYAVEEGGTLKFFKVKNGRRPGFVFLDVQASDDWFSIRVAARRAAILATIAQDPQAAMIRYGKELGVCGRCGRTLTDEESRAAGIGPVCIDK